MDGKASLLSSISYPMALKLITSPLALPETKSLLGVSSNAIDELLIRSLFHTGLKVTAVT